MADRIGQHFGDYRLVRWLGGGSFGDVYLGEHIHDHTQAAVKVLQARLTNNEDLKEFINEARTFRLKHAHIVQLLDFGIGDGDIPFIVMDYAPNGTLRQRHPRGVQLPLTTIVTYIRPVASALQYAHDRRLIHRDVKPENILLGPDNEVWLSDFGIAVVAHSTRSLDTQSGGGTVPYMAPEQIQGKPRSASDQYALGIIVYEWLCGTRPFRGTAVEIAMQHALTPPPPLREKLPTILPAVEQVVLTALAKDPKDRFASVQAFATALEQACQSEQVFSAAPTRLATTPPPPAQPTRETPPSSFASTRPAASLDKKVEPPLVVPVVSNSDSIPVPTASLSDAVFTPSAQPVMLPKRRISRRTVLIGLAAVGTAVTGGGLTWWVLAPHPLYTYRGHSSQVHTVAWSPNGTRIASGCGGVFGNDTTIQVWDAADGGQVYTYHGHNGSASAVAWSPDGRRIASGSGDTTVQVWDAANGGNVYTYRGHSGSVTAVAWSPDGRRIASGSFDHTVQVWDAATGGNVFTYQGHSDWVWAVAWSPDGRRIASGSGDVQVWDAATGGNVFTYQGHSGWVYAVAWSPDGRRIASGHEDSTVQVSDAAEGGHTYTYRGHAYGVWSVPWSPDSTRIASGSDDMTVQVWKAI